MAVPLYEGKMVQMMTHGAAEIISPALIACKEVPGCCASVRAFLPDAQYWVCTDDFKSDGMPSALLGFTAVSRCARPFPNMFLSWGTNTATLLVPKAYLNSGCGVHRYCWQI